MEFPDKLIRGIANKDFLDLEGRACAALFQFDDVARVDDDYMEASINWFDDEGALTEIFEKRKETGELQFKSGAAILSRQILDILLISHTGKGRLTYERNPEDNNPYHGNLLLVKGLQKSVRVMISGQIAMCVERIMPLENKQSAD